MGMVIIVALQWGRPILIPIALAVLLTFLLNPIVKVLQRRGLSRVLSVMMAVSAAGIILVCLGWMLTRQVTGVLAELPQNTANIRAKVKSLRQLGSGPLIIQFEQMFEEISQEIQAIPKSSKLKVSDDPTEDGRLVTAVDPVALPAILTPWSNVTGYLSSALEVLTTLPFALVLLVFFLLGREDLRDRIVLLAGKARLALTSKALEDIANRISHYIVMVALLNGGFGLVLTLGLLMMQVPYALLWGFMAAGLRFIPYLGPWIGALFPIIMSLATFEGWWQPLAVLSFVIILELTSNNIVEPMVFSHSTGVSPTALLISAAFWLYLWGPIGLVMSAPFAVCLVVLGKNIPQIGFLNLLLGDIPALRAHVGLYQRLMLGDQQEAVSLVLNRMNKETGVRVYDEMLIPAIYFAKRDAQRDYLNDDDLSVVSTGIATVLAQTAMHSHAALNAHVPPGDQGAEVDFHSVDEIRPVILGCPAVDAMDEMGLEMLRQLLNPLVWNFEAAAAGTLTSELMDRIIADPPAIVCIASVPPGGMAHARYICKRLRDASPEILIIVGRWGAHRNAKVERERLTLAGANFVTTTLLETRQLLQSRLPLMRTPTRRVQETVSCET